MATTKGLVVGLDMALNNTGVCFSLLEERNHHTHYFRLSPISCKVKNKLTWKNKFDRLMEYAEFFDREHSWEELIFTFKEVELFVVEDYSYSTRKSKSLTGMGEQRGVFYTYLWTHLLSDRLILPSPGTLKKFAVGVGRMDKEIFVQKVALKYKREFESSDECDAYVLAKIGQAVLQWKDTIRNLVFRNKGDVCIPSSLKKYQVNALLDCESTRNFIGVNQKGQKVT